MKKLVLASLAVLAPISANAAEITPYVSEKISYSFTSVSNAEVGAETWSNKGTDEKDNVLGNRLAIGLAAPISAISGALRAELEWGWNAKMNIDSDMATQPTGAPETIGFANDIKTNTFAVNAYYDLDTGTAFKPYVGAGFGVAHINYDTQSYGLTAAGQDEQYGKGSTESIVWSVGAGVSYDIDANIAIDLGYRYTDFGTVNGLITSTGFDNFQKLSADLSSHEVNIGVRYAF
ncbi:MAG: outer membrane beta-barrel protein [Rickettsiales bacterium]|jgi:opacity protein-like surface antigen|nr:outer membrane beta-barrel protein [Rickettsiales bacterium]